jgi:DNA-binding protein H-NS
LTIERAQERQNKPIEFDVAGRKSDCANRRVKKMNHALKSMSLDQLWSFYLEVASALAHKIPAEVARLDQRLRELGSGKTDNAEKKSNARRPYPRVFPKFKNPMRPSETWTGRGKQPRWLTAQLRSGKKLDDFRIKASSDRRSFQS